MAKNSFEPNMDGWAALAKEIIATEGVKRMERVADACNVQDDVSDEDGYRVSVEGSGPHLQKHDFRATVITATAEAMALNASRNTLIKNFHLAGGDS